MSISLNERQEKAIRHVSGPMLVVAGAGTGKTTVLVERIAHLIAQGHARPQEVLALTFTDNAAQELAARVRQRLDGKDCAGLQATTFHAYCFGLLARHGQAFRVLTREDLYIYLRRKLHRLPLDFFQPAHNPGEFLQSLLDFYDRCHDEQVTPADYQRYVQKVWTEEFPAPRVRGSKQAGALSLDEVVARCQEISVVFRQVEEMLALEGLGTFGHMVRGACQLLREDEEALRQAQSGARFLLLDEFQDVNAAQIDLAQLLAGRGENVFGVGDPDQAIYRFRGASAAAFQQFARRFPKTRLAVLEENQRSHTAVLKCASASISNNPALGCRVGSSPPFERRELQSARDAREPAKTLPPVPVEIVICEGDEEEANHVARAVQKLREGFDARSPARDGKARPYIGILYRLHSHRKALVNELAARNLPFAVTGINALETREVRDLLACLRVATSMADSGCLFRVAAMPMFQLDPLVMREALANAGRDADFLTLLEDLPGADQLIVATEEAWITARNQGMDSVATLEFMVEHYGFDPDAPAVKAFRHFVREWRKKPFVRTGELDEFLDYMDYFPEAGGTIEVPSGGAPSPDVVQLMTVHAAKGLEFDHLFILRANSSSFPCGFREPVFEFPAALRKGLAPEGEDKEIHRQEERRLFYVAMTRARESLTICARPGRSRKDPRPQAFVREIMDAAPRAHWRMRHAEPFTVDLAASEAAAASEGIGAWMLLPPPSAPRTQSLSATSIESYEACPLKFKIDRDWRVPGQVAASLQYGHAVHTVLKDYGESVRAGRPKDEAQLCQLLLETIRALHFDDPHQRELFERQGSEHLRNFMRLRQAAPPADIVAVERTFEITIGGVRVKGRIDRIDRITGQRVAVIDYKTGAPRNEKDARESLQLSIYALAAREQWKYEPERLVFYNLRDNSEVSGVRTDADLADARERVRQAASRIADGHFEPTPGFHCRRCRYFSICPATEERLYLIHAEAANVN